jgi:hypothetical protein
MIRSQMSRQKRIDAILKCLKEHGELDLKEVNQMLNTATKFANQRELGQIFRQIKPHYQHGELRWPQRI